jgi:acyl-homoserine lactone acylase PvdQ
MRRRHVWTITGAIGLAAAVLAGAGVVNPVKATLDAGRYQGFGDAGGFLNVLPPGQKGVFNAVETLQAAAGSPPAHAVDQRAMYDNLVGAVPGLTEAQLKSFFKDASFGVRPDDIGRVYSPTTGVTVVRDKSFGVPHIYGSTRSATMFAQGYTTAEDRLFLMDALRHVGRARLSEFLGPSPANQAMDRAQLAVAPYTEADLSRQVTEMEASGAEGAAVAADFRAYARGVNAYIGQALLNPLKLPAEYPALQVLPKPWTPEDSVAIGSYVGGRLGKGGGNELGNLCGLKAIASELGDAGAAREVFDDLMFDDDPEAPTTSARPAPYPTGLGRPDPAATPDVDCSTLTPVAGGSPSLDDLLDAIRGLVPLDVEATGPFGSFSLGLTGQMSNALLVNGDRTTAGRPIAVMGPQVGYFSPQVLVEKDVHGPGIDARGVAFPGTDAYIQMGRGRGFAWSATSSGADNIDQVVLRLCDPAGGPASTTSTGEIRDGRCEPLESFQHVQVAKPTLGGLPDGPDLVLSWPVQRSATNGPVVARGRLADGTPIAVATRRSTYRNELQSAFGFRRLNDPAQMREGFSSFRQAVAGIDYTFNWFYVDDKDIGYQHSCRCPQRARGVDPKLPSWGTGEWDWDGVIPRSSNPWDLNPESGYLSSWNNRQAPGFTAADDQSSAGPVYRSQLLDGRIERALAAGKVDRAAVVSVVEDAGTVDLRGESVLPLMLEVMGPTPPAGLDPRLAAMRDRLVLWVEGESHRRDANGDGAYDDPFGPALMDAWWEPAVGAIFDRTSGHAFDHLGLEVHDPPQHHVGSSFQSGAYSHVNKDLRQVLGEPVRGRFSQTYCGGGALSACRQALWRSLAAAASALEGEFASASMAGWQRRPADDQIEFSAVGLTNIPPMRWVNRPTFQQVVQVGVPTP